MANFRAQMIAARKKREETLDVKENRQTRFKATMGDGAGNVRDATDPRYVFIRRLGRGRVERVLCLSVSPRNNLPIIVGYSHERPDELQVLAVDTAAMDGLGGFAYNNFHHEQHELNNTLGGDDVVWVREQQFMHLLVQVQDPVSLFLDVRPGVYAWNGDEHLFLGAQTVDMSTYEPAAGLAAMVLIYLDCPSNMIDYIDGVDFVSTLPVEFRESQIPAALDDTIPLAAVYVENGLTEVDWDVVYDRRMFLQTIGDNGDHNLLSLTHTDTSPDTAVAGDIIYGGAGSNWNRLPIQPNDYWLLCVNAAGTLPEWQSFDWDDHIITGGGDGVHTHANNNEGGQLIKGTTDTNFTQGEVFYAGVGGVLGGSSALFWDLFALGVGSTDSNPGVTSDRAVTVADLGTRTPVFEMWRRDDTILHNQEIGAVRWIAGLTVPTQVAEIRVVADGVYEDAATMQFWVSSGGIADLVAEIRSDGRMVIGDVAGGNYSLFTEEGELFFANGATMWDDVRVPGLSVARGASAPDLGAFLGAGNLQVYRFDGGVTMEQVFFTIQLPHTYMEGTDLYPHVHWSPVNGNAGNVRWYLEYSWANVDATFPAVTTIGVTDAAAGVAWDHQYAPFAQIDGDGMLISSMLVCRLYRDPTDVLDTYGSDAAFLEFDCHMRVNSVGSRQEMVK